MSENKLRCVMASTEFYLRYLLGKVLGHFPYQLVFQRVKNSLRKISPSSEVWIRHSGASTAFVSGISDLDITIMFENESSENLDKLGKWSVSQRRKFRGALDFNIYQKKSLLEFISFANFYEIQRDKELFSKYSDLLSAPNSTHKFTFILRNLYLDRRRLFLIPGIRSKKWQRHFEDMEISIPSKLNFETVFNQCVLLCPFELNSHDTGILKKFVMGDWEARRGDTSNILPKLFVHFFKEDISKMENEIDKSLVRSQIGWEIFGLYGQYVWLKATRNQHPWLKLSLEEYDRICDLNGFTSEAEAVKKLKTLLFDEA